VYLLRRYKIPAAIALSVALMGDARRRAHRAHRRRAASADTSGARQNFPAGVVWCVLMIVAGLVCLYPPVFTKLVNVALRKLKRPELSAIPKTAILPAADPRGICAVDLLGASRCGSCSRAVTDIEWNALPRLRRHLGAGKHDRVPCDFSPRAGIGFREIFLFLGLDPLIGACKCCDCGGCDQTCADASSR